jgi:hypothetical protein
MRISAVITGKIPAPEKHRNFQLKMAEPEDVGIKS